MRVPSLIARIDPYVEVLAQTKASHQQRRALPTRIEHQPRADGKSV
jgi:hypothetical protein